MLELAFIVLAHVAEELVHRMPDRRLRRLHMVLIVNQPEYVEYQLAAVFALDVGDQFVHIRVLFEHLLQYLKADKAKNKKWECELGAEPQRVSGDGSHKERGRK